MSLSQSPFLPAFGSIGPVIMFYLLDGHIIGQFEFTIYYARFTSIPPISLSSYFVSEARTYVY